MSLNEHKLESKLIFNEHIKTPLQIQQRCTLRPRLDFPKMHLKRGPYSV